MSQKYKKTRKGRASFTKLYLLHRPISWQSGTSIAQLNSSVFENYQNEMLYPKKKSSYGYILTQSEGLKEKSARNNELSDNSFRAPTNNICVSPTVSSNLIEDTTETPGITDFPCNICIDVFSSLANLKTHKATHYKGTTSVAVVAGWYERRTGGLKLHTCDKSFTCEACDYKAYEEMQNVDIYSNPCKHTYTGSDKQYICETCGKGFNHSSSLSRHRLTHFDGKRFTCKTCGKSFTQSSSLKTHQYIHTGEKPFGCKLCHKKFNSSSNLKIHLLTHGGQGQQKGLPWPYS